MRRHSPSYSPPRRSGRGRSPARGRYSRRKEAPCGLLVRNIPKDSRPEEVRVPFEKYGRVRDVYLPKDYYTGEPRGFGFVQFIDPSDAADAKRHMDRQIFRGREITVVFAEENRKRPEEMRAKARSSSRRYGSSRRSRSPYHGRSSSRSPRYRSTSPRSGRYSRSVSRSSESERYSRSPCKDRRSRSKSWDRSVSRSQSGSPPARIRSPFPKRSNSKS